MTFKTNTRYRLKEADMYDDDLGTGYAYAETYGQIECEGMIICDCWITDEFGNVHPGYDQSPVPVRFCDLVASSAEPGRLGTRSRSTAMWA